MFDVGFSELMVIALVALIVLGPERLPRVARTAGHLLGRLQRYVGDVKADINREIQLEELKKMQQQVEDSARNLESGVMKELTSVESALNRSFVPAEEPSPADAGPSEPAPADAAAIAPQPEVHPGAAQAADQKTA